VGAFQRHIVTTSEQSYRYDHSLRAFHGWPTSRETDLQQVSCGTDTDGGAARLVLFDKWESDLGIGDAGTTMF